MRAVHTRDELRAADEAAIAEVGFDALVSRAGSAVAHAAIGLLGVAYGKRVVVVAGRGHNGDDGRVAAAALRRRGVRVTEVDPRALPARLPACDLVVDAAYGTGFRGEYRAPEVPAGTPVLAIDIPSGLDADTGLACEGAVSATATVTMAALKPGLLMGDGPALAGSIEVAPIGIAVAPGQLWLAPGPRARDQQVALGMSCGRGLARDDRSGAVLVQCRSTGRSRHGALVRAGRVAGGPAFIRGGGVVGSGGRFRRCRAQRAAQVPGTCDRSRDRIGTRHGGVGQAPGRRGRGARDRRRGRAGSARSAGRGA